jgi:hypothetical protein
MAGWQEFSCRCLQPEGRAGFRQIADQLIHQGAYAADQTSKGRPRRRGICYGTGVLDQ